MPKFVIAKGDWGLGVILLGVWFRTGYKYQKDFLHKAV